MYTPSYVAIQPHIKLFNIVKGEYSKDSTINTGETFGKYYLRNRWNYVNMARDCIRSKTALRNCNIIPPKTINTCVTGEPFWFDIVQTRFDGDKLSSEEICDRFWKSLNGTGCSLYILGMTFNDITNHINECIEMSNEHPVPVNVKIGDVVCSCRKINKKKNQGWFGRKCLGEYNNGSFKKSSRPKVGRNPGHKKQVVKDDSNVVKHTIKPVVIRTMTFAEKEISVTTNFK